MFRRLLAVALFLVGWVSFAQAKDYDFALQPGPALTKLASLKHMSKSQRTVAAAELALFADPKLERHSFAEAALIASGVVDAEKRTVYLDRIDRIEAEARKAVAGARTVAEKGEKLLQFLHVGPMKEGYEGQQSLIDVLLDTGKFNCVSSAVFYNIFARRLGLGARGGTRPRPRLLDRLRRQ